MRIPFQIAVHDGEEDLQEQIDGVYEHGEEVEPCFSRHDDDGGAEGPLCLYYVIWIEDERREISLEEDQELVESLESE